MACGCVGVPLDHVASSREGTVSRTWIGLECVSLHTYRTAGEWTDAEGMEKGPGREGVMMLCDWRAGAGTLTLADGNKYVDCQQDGQGEARVGEGCTRRGGEEGWCGKAVHAAPLGRWWEG